MEKRIRSAFEGVILNEKRKEEIIDDVLNGSMKERSMKGNKTDFWLGRLGGTVIVAAAILVFVVVNLIMFGKRGENTPAGEIMGTEITVEEPGVLDENETAKTLADYIDVERVAEIRLNNGETPVQQGGPAVDNEIFSLLWIYEEIPEKKDEFNPGQWPNVYGTQEPLYCITFYFDIGGTIWNKMDVREEPQTYFDELNIYDETEISLNGVHYRAQAGDLIEKLEASRMDMEKFSEESVNISDRFTEEDLSESGLSSKGILPVKGGEITSAYGERWGVFHEGVDFISDDTNVYLSMNGTVIHTGFVREKGNYVEVDHGNGVTSEYHHLESIAVAEGDSLSVGTVIGIMGNTGDSTGTHLHWEIRVNGEPVNPIEAISTQ